MKLQSEVTQLIGWSPGKEAILEQKGVQDRWFIAARKQTEQDRLTQSATWLYGFQSKRWALKLEFAAQPTRPVEHWPLGATVETDLVYYPGAHPDRVLPRNAAASPQIEARRPPPGSGFKELLQDYAGQLAENPWRTRRLFYIAAQPTQHDGQYFLIDSAGDALPWLPRPQEAELIDSLCGGHPIPVCGEWNGHSLQLHSAEDGDAWLPIASLLP